MKPATNSKVLLFANTEWYLYNFRRSLAAALRDAGFELILVSPPGPYGAKLQELGFRWLPAPMERRSVNPLRELRLLGWLVQLMRRERFALVHSFTIKSAVYGSLAARLANVPARLNAVAGMGYVFSSPDVRAKTLRPIVRALLKVAFNGTNARLILQNPDDVAFFKRTGLVEPEQIRLIPGSGVDCTCFQPLRAGRPAEAPLRLLLAARLLWDKGLAEYVEAARMLRKQGRKLRFLLAGTPDPGNPAAVPEKTLHTWVSEGLVEWLGHVDDMAALLPEVDVAILPTAYGEGLPRFLIEAAACGLPLITTDAPGCREVVVDGIDGLLVPVRNSAALAAAIARLQDNPELARNLGRAAREKALSQFDERIVIDRTLAVYRELLPAS